MGTCLGSSLSNCQNLTDITTGARYPVKTTPVRLAIRCRQTPMPPARRQPAFVFSPLPLQRPQHRPARTMMESVCTRTSPPTERDLRKPFGPHGSGRGLPL